MYLQIASPLGAGGATLAVDPYGAFTEFLATLDLAPGPNGIVDDDRWNRCHATSKKGRNTDGAYIFAVNFDGFAFGYAHNHLTGVAASFHSQGYEVTPERKADIDRQREKRVAAQEKEAAEKLQSEMAVWEAADRWASHPYLTEKDMPARGDWRQDGTTLLIPSYRGSEVVGFQRIFDKPLPNGKRKLYCKGFPRGAYYPFQGTTETVAIAEGIATAYSVHAATGWTTYAAWDAGRLLDCAKDVRAQYPAAQIVIAGDNDVKGVGQRKAAEAAQAVGGRAMWPDVPGTDWDDVRRAGGAA